MQVASMPLLTAWQNFYVIIGTAAASLTGLMFVVITLIVGSRLQRGGGAFAAFGTPTVVHFCVALLVAAILSAPWQALWNAVLLLGFAGLGGVAYIVIIMKRMRNQSDYLPVLEDWLWHVIIPLVSYIALVVAALVLLVSPAPALFIIGAVTLLLLFTGIHNSWDSVTYIAVERFQQGDKSQDENSSSPGS